MIKRKFIIILLINTIILSGCWNYKDINKMRFVAGMAIDYDSDSEEFIITVEIINPIAEALEGEIFQTRGKSVFEAVRDVIMKNGRKLYVAHMKVVIISKSVAEKKLINVIDYISRDAEYRKDVLFLVSKEDTAMEVLIAHELEHKEEKSADLHAVSSYYIESAVKNQDSISKYYGVELWRFLKNLYDDGVSPTLPVIKVREEEKQHSISEVLRGLAVFNKFSFIGWLDGIEARAFLWILGDLNGGIIVVDSTLDNIKYSKVSLEIINSKTKIKPIYINNQLTISIDIKCSVDIGEIGGTTNFIDKEGRKRLENDTKKIIKKQIEDTILKVQKEYNTDIFKFCNVIKKEMPSLWKEVKSNWQYVFSNLSTEVNVDIKIVGSALTDEPIKISY